MASKQIELPLSLKICHDYCCKFEHSITPAGRGPTCSGHILLWARTCNLSGGSAVEKGTILFHDNISTGPPRTLTRA